ncbi:MAG: DUF1931 domain-containing protein [Candidatus Pacearchaeota archaeon]
MAEKKAEKQAQEKNIELIVKSKIKSAVPELQVSSDVPAALNAKVLKILEEASQRAKANGRRTLQAKDL